MRREGKLFALGFAIATGFFGTASSLRATESRDLANLTIRIEPPTISLGPVYIGVVSVNSPWSSPAAEKVLAPGERRWRFELPPGQYRVAAGAPGTEVLYGPEITLSPRSSEVKAMALQPLQTVRGKLLDSQGRPAVGARVGWERQFLADFPLRLSPLAEEHLKSCWEARTDEAGRFSIGLVPDLGHFLRAELASTGSTSWRNLRASPDLIELEEELLTPGAELRLRWLGKPPRGLVELVPQFGSREERAVSLAVHRREAESEQITWPVVEPGRYALRFRPAEGAAEPVELITMNVVASPELRLLEAAAPALPELPIAAAETRLRVLGWAGDPGGSILAERWRGGEVSSYQSAARPVAGGHLVELPADCKTGDRWLLRHRGQLAASQPLGAGDCDRPQALQSFSEAAIAGRFLPPREGAAPKSVLWTAEECRGQGPDFRWEIPSPINPQGQFESFVPVSCARLTARFAAFAFESWAPVRLAEAKLTDLGVRPLRWSGSVLVRLVDAATGRALDDLSVSAHSLGRSGLESRPDASAVTAGGGWARLAGLVPGAVFLRVTTPPGPVTHWFPESLEVHPSREALLDPWEIPGAARLEVLLDPNATLALEGVSATLLLAGQGRRGAPGSIRETELAGDRVIFPALPPGRWQLTPLVRLESGQLFPLEPVEVTLAPGEDRQLPLLVGETLHRGQVTWQGLPVAGDLTLDLRDSEPPRRVHTRVHADGRFSVPLARAGTYQVIFSDDAGAVFRAVVPEVEFPEPPREARVELPTGVIRGFAVAEPDRPLPRVRISGEWLGSDSAREGQPQRFTRTDPTGAFFLSALSAGPWLIEARSEEGGVASETIELLEGELRDSVRLVLKPPKRASGTVRGADGTPSAGARGVVRTVNSSGVYVTSHRWQADAEGRFDYSLEGFEAATELVFEVSTSEGVNAIRALHAPSVDLVLPSSRSGTVTIQMPARSRFANGGSLWLVDSNRNVISVVTAATSLTTGSGPAFFFEGLPVGRWKLVECKTAAEEAALLSSPAFQIAAEGLELEALQGVSANLIFPEPERSVMP